MKAALQSLQLIVLAILKIPIAKNNAKVVYMNDGHLNGTIFRIPITGKVKKIPNNTTIIKTKDTLVLVWCSFDKLWKLPITPKKINMRKPKISRIEEKESPEFETVLLPKNFASDDTDFPSPFNIVSAKGYLGSVQW